MKINKLFNKLVNSKNKKEVKEIVDKLPCNVKIAEEVLKENGSSTKFVLKDDIKSSYYIFLNDTIYLADNDKVRSSEARLTLILHEIRHSMQSKILQIINFSLANIELLAFVISLVLLIFNVNKDIVLLVYGIIVILSMIPRTILELDAIINSIKMSRKYLEKKVSEKETDMAIKRCRFFITILTPILFISIFYGRVLRYIIMYLIVNFVKGN